MEERLDEFERLSMYKAGYITMNWMMSVMAILGFGIFLYSLIIEPQMNLLLLVGVLYILLSYKYFRVSNQLMHGSKAHKNKGGIT
jgi:xanthosine utilization system XapX-like protein